MKRILFVALLLSAPLLSGCAEKWEKPGAGEAEFRAMQAKCDAMAYERWPPRLREELVFPGAWIPPVRRCDSRGHCHWSGGFFDPPRTMVTDDHARPRSAERRACYVGQGWTPVDD